jgi:hypothetical protein
MAKPIFIPINISPNIMIIPTAAAPVIARHHSFYLKSLTMRLNGMPSLILFERDVP